MREPRPDWSPLGVNFKILDEHPHLFIFESPPGVSLRFIDVVDAGLCYVRNLIAPLITEPGTLILALCCTPGSSDYNLESLHRADCKQL